MCPVNSLGHMQPVPWLKVASDKPKKRDKGSCKEGKDSTSITDISITLCDCYGQSKSARTHVFVCISITNISKEIIYNNITPSGI